eukprot:s2051_g12.t3
MGSVSHIGPEVLKSPEKYTHACDCWSCGIIFYHLICGFLPFHEEKEAAADKLSVLLSAVSASSSPQLACTDGMLDGLKTA